MHLTMEDIYNKGLEFGKAENRIEVAISMLKEKLPLELIVKITSLRTDKVLDLQKTLACE